MNKTLTAFVRGKVKPLSSVNDPVFAQGMLGVGLAITPIDDVIVSPCDGVVSMVFPTQHAFGIHVDGMDLLIHIGIDTVSLNGKHFKALIKEGDQVRQGQPCVQCDFKQIQAQGLSIDTMMVLTEKPEHRQVTLHDLEKDVDIGDLIASYTI